MSMGRPQPYRLNQAWGAAPFRACRADRRFSYSVYLPSAVVRAPDVVRPLLVLVHGTDRRPEQLRDLFEPLAEELGCVLLLPFFPAAVTDDEALHNYIFLDHGHVRYDRILLSMVEEVGQAHRVQTERFWMGGFSGGAQFALRFAYLHAARLAGVSVAAPGMVTLPTLQHPWPAGVQGLSQQLGQGLDHEGLARLPFHIAVGGEDTADEVMVPPGHPLHCEGINDSGRHRVERAVTLQQALREAGFSSRLDVVPGGAHLPHDLYLSMAAFFRRAWPQAGA